MKSVSSPHASPNSPLGVCRFSIPEKRVEQAPRACVVHTMLATRLRGGQRFQTDGLPYPNIFMLCLSDYQMLYDSVGLYVAMLAWDPEPVIAHSASELQPCEVSPEQAAHAQSRS